MTRYIARDLAALPEKELWDLPDGPVELVFDDLPDGTPQVMQTDSRLTIFSAYMWRLIVEYPHTPMKFHHHIGTERINNKTHMTLLKNVMWDTYKAYDGEVDIEELCLILYRQYNAWYNAAVLYLAAEVSTISIEDLIDVVEEPRVEAAIEGITGSPMSIDHAYAIAEEVLKENGALPGNPISASVRSGLVSLDQVKQCLIARGRVTDLDSWYFPEAIPSSFLSGMNSVYESMTESRTSTKAAAYKEKPIQDSEYFNRRLQLLAATVQAVEYVNETNGKTTIIPGDCGSQRFVRWAVKAKDLVALEGKYYRTEDDTTLRLLKNTDRHLIDTVIHFRSPALCNHEAQQSVCAVCYGDIALSLPRHTNIGHVAAVEYGERVTQNMLAIKHVDFASGERKVKLGPYEKEFLTTVMDTRSIRLQAKYAKYKLTLSIAPDEAQQLTEINFVDDVTALPVSRISEISDFYMTLTSPQGETETVRLNVEIAGKRAHFSHAMLAHIQQHGYTLSDTGRYKIELEGFDREQALFEVPNRDVNILDYLNSIIQFISSTDEKSKDGNPDGPRRMLKQCRSLEEALTAFHALTSERMIVNIVHLEILVYATMIRSHKARDYRLPHPGNGLMFGQLSKLISNRSLSAAMAFEKHSSVLNDPATYVNRTRTDHPLDDLLVPRNAAI